MTVYEVKPGDTVTAIADMFGVSRRRLIEDNGLDAPGMLVPGQSLLIRFPETVHTVANGDTLFSIAQRYGTTVRALLRNQPRLTSSGPLVPGSEIVVSFTDKPRRAARINGYAYPYISRELLRYQLPFLSTLTIFGYGFMPSGELIVPDDGPLIDAADEFDVAPILLLSSVTENGTFSSERARMLFNTPSLQETVLGSLADIMDEKGYRGLDIDFEYVNEADTDAFLSFIGRAVEIMHGRGYFVNVDLAPKASANQRGLLYEAHNYPLIGSLADTVLLMTYEWGYTYGPPMAVAPLNQVERIVTYGVSEIPVSKIMLGVPNYGYDWPLPFEKGITRARSIGNQEAVLIAGENRADIEFDRVSASPFFFYTAGGISHEVWFEDVRSIAAKFDLADRFGLLGFGYWNLMRPFAVNWSLAAITYTPTDV